MLFIVSGDTGGAHEHQPVYSIWTTRDAAERECERLRAVEHDTIDIIEVPENVPSDTSINW